MSTSGHDLEAHAAGVSHPRKERWFLTTLGLMPVSGFLGRDDRDLVDRGRDPSPAHPSRVAVRPTR